MRASITVLSLLMLLVVSAASAQESRGQLWVELYEDRNGNALKEPNEPPITRGVSVSLLNAANVIVASASVEDSLDAARGLIGFQYLPAGAYSVTVTSALYAPTSQETPTRNVLESGSPPVIAFGLRRADGTSVNNEIGLPAVTGQRREIGRIAVAGMGASLVMAGMTLVGIVIASAALAARRPKRRQPISRTATVTGIQPTATDTGMFKPPPVEGEPRN